MTAQTSPDVFAVPTSTRAACTARQPLTPMTLRRENRRHAGTAALSQGNRHLGFRPAFLDSETGDILLARFADGRPAPLHLLDGLPDHLVTSRDPNGRVVCVAPGVVSGFERDGRFFTREEAMRSVDDDAAETAASDGADRSPAPLPMAA